MYINIHADQGRCYTINDKGNYIITSIIMEK